MDAEMLGVTVVAVGLPGRDATGTAQEPDVAGFYMVGGAGDAGSSAWHLSMIVSVSALKSV